MKLKILVDNNTLSPMYAEWGFSVYLEEGDTRVLFDLGTTDLLLKNADRWNIDLTSLDAVVISHGHHDHTWGLQHLVELYEKNEIAQPPTLVAHPNAFLPKLLSNGKDAGMKQSQEELAKHFTVNPTKEPLWLTDRLVFLGEIPRKRPFEGQKSMGNTERDGQVVPDFLLDDSALVYQSAKGLVIITGCSHSGICNIIDHATQICQDQRIVDIIGGLHLMNASEEQLTGTFAYFRQVMPKSLHACHCTGVKAQVGLGQITDLQDTGVGVSLEWE